MSTSEDSGFTKNSAFTEDSEFTQSSNSIDYEASTTLDAEKSPSIHYDLISFLGTVQYAGVPILPLNWSASLEQLGAGGDGVHSYLKDYIQNLEKIQKYQSAVDIALSNLRLLSLPTHK
ncbi:hypothetical protein ABW20_dc0106371 [Dactylellina cionopaga]|nr:hypothetical protein ABW20_dc0106371 [Dactylellina cionopaga]